MNLKYQSSDAWSKKSNKELRELISQGVEEVNRRRSSIKSKTEQEYINRIEKMQGVTQSGEIKRTSYNLSHKELQYRARMIDQFLDVDTSSDIFKENKKASVKEARNTFNERYGMKLTLDEYGQMVELMGAFKDKTEGFGSSQIAEFVDYAKKNGVSIDSLPPIFARAIQLKGVTEHARMEYIFDEIDSLVL